jgi:hypothetical protein
MFALLESPIRIARDVDGGVQCPVRLELIDPRTCESCKFLSHTSFDRSGAITGLVCTPTIRAMMKET